MTHTGSHQTEPLGLDAPRCIPAEHIHVEQCCRAGAAELAAVEAERDRLREALTKIAATHERNRWHPNTSHPTEFSKHWHDGFISCAAGHSITATAALDPERAAEQDRVWRVGVEGTDSDWWRETGHCGHCGVVASACECDGECGCWEDHGPPLKPWRGVIGELKARVEEAAAERDVLGAQVEAVRRLSKHWLHLAGQACDPDVREWTTAAGNSIAAALRAAERAEGAGA